MIVNVIDFENYLKDYPNEKSYFSKYGGSQIPDSLKKTMDEIKDTYFSLRELGIFISELNRIRKEFLGRTTSITHLKRLSDKYGKVQIYC